MKTFRAHWSDDRATVTHVEPALRVVSRSAPPRPRWRKLYLALLAVSILGAVAHHIVRQRGLVEVVDIGCPLIVVAVLVWWLHVNRIALARLAEPASGIGTPSVRVIRSRPPDAERVLLPYDSR